MVRLKNYRTATGCGTTANFVIGPAESPHCAVGTHDSDGALPNPQKLTPLT